MKNILFVVPVLRPGGASSALVSLCNQIQTDSIRRYVWVLSYTDIDYSFLPKNVTLLSEKKLMRAVYDDYSKLQGLRKLYSFFVKSLIKSFDLIKKNCLRDYIINCCVKKVELENSFDTVIGFLEGYSTYVASFFNTKNKIAWVHVDYNVYLSKEKTELDTYNKYNHIVCVSKYIQNVFNNRYPDLKDRTLTIYNPLDFSNILIKSEYEIEDGRFNRDKFTILSVGRITPIKRFSEIPHIAKEIKSRGILFNWYILGPTRNEKEATLLMKNIKDMDVEDCVFWLGNKPNPYPYFKSSDLYVCLSYSEACPMVFNEAKVLQLPIITTNFPTAIEFIDSWKDGVISSIDKIPQIIEQLIIDPVSYLQLKENCGEMHIKNEESINKFLNIL